MSTASAVTAPIRADSDVPVPLRAAGGRGGGPPVRGLGGSRIFNGFSHVFLAGLGPYGDLPAAVGGDVVV